MRGALCARSDCWFRRMIKIHYPTIYDRYKPSENMPSSDYKYRDKQERRRNEQERKHTDVHIQV